MKIQPITTQPNFNGKVVFDNGTTKNITGMFPNVLHRKLDEVAMLVQDKPYNVFIFQNKQNPKFYNIAANKSLKDAQNVIGYTVKILSDVVEESLVEAAKEAMEMYEKFIAKGMKV